MRFSSLLDQIPNYPFWRVGQIVREVEQRDGIRIIQARIGIPDKEAPKAIKEAMAKYMLEDNSTYGYPCDVHPERGIPELIEAIIEDYHYKYGVKLAAENIAVTGWAKGILHNLVRLFDQGTIHLPDPVYPVYEPSTIIAHHRSKKVKTSKETGWLPEFRFERDSIAFYFCDPNNPTGSVADEDFYLSLFAKMKAEGVWGIFDKAYKDYIFDNTTKPLSITQVPGLINQGFEVVSFSKHYNFVGIGLGWIVSSKENIDKWLKLWSQYSQGVEWYKQKTGVEALTNPSVKEEMNIYMNELKERRDIFARGLNELGLHVDIPRATPYLWVKVPDGYSDEDFVLNKMINEARVAFMPGSYFGDNGKGYFRATIFLPKLEIEKALESINKIKSW